MGWKPAGWRWLDGALGLLDGDAGGDGFGQVAPAVDLLHGSDKDALAGGQQLERVQVELGDVAQAALRVWKQAQDLVVVHIGDAGVLCPGAEDDDELDRLGRKRQLERDGAVGPGNTEARHRVIREDGDGARGRRHGQAERGQLHVDLDGQFVARQDTGLAEDRVGLAGAGQGVPSEILLVGEGAPEGAGLLEGDPAVNLRGGAGVARDDLPAADEPITALVGDNIADAP